VRYLKLAAIAESTTLAVLVFIGVPLKHLLGVTTAVTLLGPIHGACFLFYLWALTTAASEVAWPSKDVARMLLVAIIPLAGFVNLPWLWAKTRRTSQSVRV